MLWASLKPKAVNLMKSYPSYESFFVEFNPSRQVDFGEDEKKAIMGEYSPIAVLDVAYGNGTAAAWLVEHIGNLNTYSGSKNMDDKQTKVLAQMLATEYKYMKLSVMMLFFYRFKCGHFGKFYGKVDPMVITCALKDFADECEQKRQEYINEENLVQKQQETDLRESIYRKWCDFTHVLCDQTELESHRGIYSVIYIYKLSLRNKCISISVTREQYEMLEGECYPFFSEVFRKFFPGFSIQYQVFNHV